MATLTLANCQIICAGFEEIQSPFDFIPAPGLIEFSLLPTADQETIDALDILLSPPCTCLSCGAKTNTAGELPCGH